MMNARVRRPVVRLLAFACSLAFAAATARAGEMYRFAIDRDGLTGAPACRLNSPLGPEDRIHVKDGHFYTVGADGIPDTGDDRRVRFWGINLSAPLTFPRTTAEAERLAARLEKLGINIVRLHSFENAKDKPSYLTVIDVVRRYPLLNEVNMRGLDRLLKAFGDHGIYAHFALHVSYTFDTHDYYTDEQGRKHRVPDPTKTTKRYPHPAPMPAGSEPLLMFNREMIELQKRFAAALLRRRNHLTGVRYKDDPVTATLELNNEDSLIETFHKRSENFPPLYAEELDGLWREWLRAKYGTDAALARAWEFDRTPPDDPGLVNGGFDDPPGAPPHGWILEKIADHWPPGDVDKPKVNDWGSFRVNGKDELEVTVSKTPPTYWHFFVAQRGIHLTDGYVYRIRFKAWADAPRKIQVACQGGPNMSRFAFAKRKVAISAVPKVYEITFTSMLSDDNCRLNLLPLTSDHPFKPGEYAGKLWFDDVSITWVKPSGLRSGESLATYVARPTATQMQGYPSPARRKDYLRFLNDTERNYYREMKAYIRKVVGARQPLTGSQANYGGLLGHKNMTELMDYVDTHCYYDHCDFPPAPNQAKWSYTNRPMVENPAESVAAALAQSCAKDKPFTVTEYGPNPFNQYMVESYAIAPAYAALQDIDALFLFIYFRGDKDYRGEWNPERLTGVHNVLGDTRAEVLMNLAARLFRRGLVRPARNIIRIPIGRRQALEQLYRGKNVRSLRAWLEDPRALRDETGAPFDVRMGLISRIRIQHAQPNVGLLFPRLPPPAKDPQTGDERRVYVSDTGELRWVHYAHAKRSCFSLDTDRAKVVVGYLNGPVELSGVKIVGAGPRRQFGIVSLLSLDDQPVTASSELLITSLGGRGKSHNLKVVEVDPVKKRYRLVGPQGRPFYTPEAGPFEIETNPVTITLTSSARTLFLERLGPDGTALSRTGVAGRSGRYRFTLGRAADRTPWYRVVAVQP